MEFSADAKSLSVALEQAQEAVERKSTIPILSHVLVEACVSGLRFAATDLEVGIRTYCSAQVKKTGSVAVPARRLLEIVKSLPEADVRVRGLENNWVQVNAGRSVFKLAALARDTFPVLPNIPEPLAQVPAGVLAGLIDRTAFAISNEESRYTLNGALLVLKPGSVEMVATDGHRLPLATRDVEITGLKREERLLVPKRALAGLRRLANAQQSDRPIHIAKDDSHLFFSADDSILISRMLSGQFPTYEAVLPKNNTLTATLDVATLRESLRRVALLAPEQTHAVCFSLDSGWLTLTTSGCDTGEASETLDAAFTGAPLRIGFNASFLLDMLGVVKTGDIEIALKDAESAAEFRPTDQGTRYTYVVMPMRI
ncbi:MAG: DNA polymerase III subunit beta [Acidobacteria bacterium]|nr:MAG: DNA polymerase III subunit beta [Acidobacteriota bacterium]